MSGWIGVDFDGTLATYGTWLGPEHMGEPIGPMVERVKRWLAEGREVRIFTARVGACGRTNGDGNSDDEAFANQQRAQIERWCLQHIGQVLPVTATKDFGMLELWDDRAVQVRPNTGEPVGQSTRGLS